jgi:hypothetical protein
MWYFYNGINTSANLGTIMSLLHLSIKSREHTFEPEREAFLTKIFGAYSQDQQEKYALDLRYCEQQGWVVMFADPVNLAGVDVLDESNNVIATSFGANDTKIQFSTDGSESQIVFSGNNLQEFIDYFIIFRENFKPIIDYYNEHPEEGTVSAWVENSPNDTKTYTLHNLPSIR